MTDFVMKKMARIHCARGPKRCDICKEYVTDLKWALLNVDPTEHLDAARPMIELEFEGEMVFVPFDVIAYYDDIKDAMEYVNERGIKVEILNED